MKRVNVIQAALLLAVLGIGLWLVLCGTANWFIHTTW